jgi:hypothetical protein
MKSFFKSSEGSLFLIKFDTIQFRRILALDQYFKKLGKTIRKRRNLAGLRRWQKKVTRHSRLDLLIFRKGGKISY